MKASSGSAPAGPGPIAGLRREVIERLLGQTDYLLLVVTPGCPGVRLPEELLQAGQPVPLHIGWRLPVPIPDLRLDEAGISGTLSFQRTPHPCQLPWASIVQVSLGDEHLIWLTPELASPPAERPHAPESHPKLKLV